MPFHFASDELCGQFYLTRSNQRIQLLPDKKNNRTGDIERIGVSVNEAAEMIGLSVRSMWNLVKEGKIKHVKYGTRCIVSVKSLREFVDGKNEYTTLSTLSVRGEAAPHKTLESFIPTLAASDHSTNTAGGTGETTLIQKEQ